VISNNEMLEEALKRDPSLHARDVGWRRSSARESDSRRTSEERPSSVPPAPSSAFVDATPALDNASGTNSPAVPPTPLSTNNEERRFFKFRFTSSPNPNARPATPNGTGTGVGGGIYHHLNSPSLPSLPPLAHAKEVEELNEQLRKERAAKKKVEDEKAALEAELESLSQALFEEVRFPLFIPSSFLLLNLCYSQANKMVATERIKRAETEDELKEAFLEKEALRSALRLLEDQHSSETSSPMPVFASPSPSFVPMSAPASHSRTSSDVAIKLAPMSPSSTPARTPPPPASPSDSPLPSPSSSRPLSRSSLRHQSPPPTTIVDMTPQRQRPPPLPLCEDGDGHDRQQLEAEHGLGSEDEPTPHFQRFRPPSLLLLERNTMYEASPWADAPSQSQSHSAAPLAGAAV
jgi:hypothetical protein